MRVCRAFPFDPEARRRTRLELAGRVLSVSAVARTAAAVAGILAAGLLMAACSPGQQSEESAPAAEWAVPGEGVLWLLAEPHSNQFVLYRWAIENGSRPRQLTEPADRVSSVTVEAGRVAVSAAPVDSGQLADQIYEFRDDTLLPLVPGRVFSPALSADGTLAYEELVDAHNAGGSSRLMVEDLAARAMPRPPGPRVWHEWAGALSKPVWGPDGELAVLEVEPTSYRGHRVVIIDAGGDKRAVDAGDPPVIALMLWGPGREMVLFGPPEEDMSRGPRWLFDPDSEERTPLPEGWQPIDWSPTGDALLVAKGTRLGLVDPSEADTVKAVGRFPVPVVAGQWEAAAERAATNNPQQ